MRCRKSNPGLGSNCSRSLSEPASSRPPFDENRWPRSSLSRIRRAAFSSASSVKSVGSSSGSHFRSSAPESAKTDFCCDAIDIPRNGTDCECCDIFCAAAWASICWRSREIFLMLFNSLGLRRNLEEEKGCWKSGSEVTRRFTIWRVTVRIKYVVGKYFKIFVNNLAELFS